MARTFIFIKAETSPDSHDVVGFPFSSINQVKIGKRGDMFIYLYSRHDSHLDIKYKVSKEDVADVLRLLSES